MKGKFILLAKNIFFTTGISLTLLSLVAFFLGGHAIFIQTVWQNVLANTCIHLLLLALRQWESEYFLLDAAVDITAITILILFIAWIFKWFSSTPVYVLIPMIIFIYAIGTFFQVFRIRKELDFINQQLHQRNLKK